MSHPLQFDQVQAAQRVREAIATEARAQAKIISPPPMIARMTNVDLAGRAGEAWIIGDLEPVPVILSNTIVPASWDNKDGFDETDMRFGAGSVVVLNNYHGTLYVTQILSGGQLLNQASVYGLNIVSQMTDVAEAHYARGRGHLGYPYEHFFTIHLEVGGENFGDGTQNLATEFGPFEISDISVGRMDLFVSSELHGENHSQKIYEFVYNPGTLFTNMGWDADLPSIYDKWYRLLPKHESNNGTSGSPNDPLNGWNIHCDFDIDVCIRKPADPEAFHWEMWFRYVRYTTDMNDFDTLVTVRSTSIGGTGPYSWGSDVSRSVIKQKHIVEPAVLTPIKGYAGFHNSQHMFYDSNKTNVEPYRQNVQWESGPWQSANLSLARNLQRVWDLTEAEIFNWTGTHLTWGTGTLKFSGVGYHRNGLTDGSLTVAMPAVNSTIPIMGNDRTTVTVTSAGIPLGQYQALYLAIPPGVLNDANVKTRFFIVDDFDGQYQLPEWAVLIASRPRGSNMLRLGNGQQLDYWHNVTFLNGWTNWGSGYFNCGYMKVNGLVVLRGLAKVSATSNLMFNLPVGYRPAAYVMFAVANSETTGICQIGNQGDVTKYNGGTSYIALDNMRFRADQ